MEGIRSLFKIQTCLGLFNNTGLLEILGYKSIVQWFYDYPHYCGLENMNCLESTYIWWLVYFPIRMHKQKYCNVWLFSPIWISRNPRIGGRRNYKIIYSMLIISWCCAKGSQCSRCERCDLPFKGYKILFQGWFGWGD